MPRPKPIGLVLLTCCVAASAQSTKPAAYTERDRIADLIAYNRHTLTDAYDAAGPHRPEWDAPAHALLDRMAVRFAAASADSQYAPADPPTDLDALQALAKAAESVDDPLVGYCRAVIYRDAGQQDDYNALLRHVAPRLIAGKYPAGRRYYAADKLAALSPNDAKLAKQRDDLLLPMLTEPTQSFAARMQKVKYVVSELWHADDSTAVHPKAEDRQAVLDRLAADPKADAWMVGVLRGYHEVAWAWECRGNGWANAVTDAGWQGFFEHIAKARAAYTAAQALEPWLPNAASGMITVCMAEGNRVDNARVWFDRAKAAQIDFMPAWHAYAETLRPRWGGTMDAMYALGKEAADSRRYDTVVPFFLIDALSKMSQEAGEGNAVYRRPEAWPDLQAMFDGYLEPVAPGIDVPWCGTRRAGYAYLCGQYAEADRTFKTLGEQAREDAFEPFGLPMTEAVEECAARNGPHAALVSRAADAAVDKDYTAARYDFAEALKQVAAGDPDHAYCDRMERATAVAADVADGKRVTLPFESQADLAAWRGPTDGWTADGGTLTFNGPPDADVTLLHRADLPVGCRLRFQWQYSAPPGHGPGVGLIFRDVNDYGYLAVEQYPKDQLVAVCSVGVEARRFGLAVKKAPDDPIKLTPDAWHTLEVERTGEAITVIEDGVTLVDHLANTWFAYGTPALGLRIHNPPNDPATVRVREMTVEPLPGG